MKDPADNRTIDMLLENYLVEVTTQVRVMKAASPCVRSCDRTAREAGHRPDEKKRRSSRPNARRDA